MSDPTSDEPREYKIISTGLIHGPGIMHNFRHVWRSGDEKLALRAIGASLPNLPVGLVHAWLSGEINGHLEDDGETLVITYPPHGD